MKKLTAVVALLASSAVFASDATMRISDDAISLKLNSQISAANSAELRLMYNDDEDSGLISAGLFADGERDAFKGRLGGKLYYADLDHNSGYGLALGGELNLSMTRNWWLDLGLYYGPSVLSFSDIDGYKEWFVRASYEVFENARLGAGYGSLKVDPDRGRDAKIEDGFFVEMHLGF